ncbi:kinetoplast-associated protein 1-like [Aquila chrysaetos chrysaetos]|uniref:kinetoplast-associated protein 1-like n=1 Tax=Aquila chrysaetos chrysaetos TaxID=223781 RepID=UPI0011765B75|nr:kinetoplast-associated protein 1-like [Aquila chrysaetos chrysaetos]
MKYLTWPPAATQKTGNPCKPPALPASAPCRRPEELNASHIVVGQVLPKDKRTLHNNEPGLARNRRREAADQPGQPGSAPSAARGGRPGRAARCPRVRSSRSAPAVRTCRAGQLTGRGRRPNRPRLCAGGDATPKRPADPFPEGSGSTNRP